jgi:hypothetical protein
MAVNEHLRILELIESGRITVEEGVRRLEGLDHGEDPVGATDSDAVAGPPSAAAEPATERVSAPYVRIVWQIVFGLGTAVMAGGGLLLARAYVRDGMPGLTIGWILFVLGVLIMGLGWWLQRARWFTLRVREHEGAAFTLALPLPLGVVLWLLRIAKPFVPQLQELEVDRLMVAMRDDLEAGRPLSIQVDEGENGDHVEIYFG